MKPSLFIIFILILVKPGCDSPQNQRQEQPNDVELYSYEIQTISASSEGCSESCPQVNINFPQFKEGLDVHETYNQTIRQSIKSEISNYLMQEVHEEIPINEFAQSFLQGYEAFKKQSPENPSPWELKIDVVVGYIHDALLSLSLNSSSYTGGAHPNNQVTYYNLSSTGETLTLKDFVTDREAIKIIAEQKFRSKYQLGPEADLAEAGFLFDDNTFQLTDNFGFTRAGLVFYYNSYEIAPYSAGPTVLLIPLEELTHLLK